MHEYRVIFSHKYVFILNKSISEREKEEERKKREDEKRQKMEAEQNKNRKTAEAFFKFFKKVENKPDSNEQGEKMDADQVPQTFVSFQVKDNMKMAAVNRRTLNREERTTLDNFISSDIPSADLYLTQLKNNAIAPRKTVRTLPSDDDDKSNNADDLFIMGNIWIYWDILCVCAWYSLQNFMNLEEDGQNVQVLKEEPKKLYRAKFFKFSENRRPAYYGTWRKTSKTINARKPLALDSVITILMNKSRLIECLYIVKWNHQRSNVLWLN